MNESALEKKLRRLLKKKEFESVFSTLLASENESVVTSDAWNLVSLIFSTLKSDRLLEDGDDIAACEEILLFLCDKGNPKEILVALLEQADSFKDHECFCLFLNPLRETLKRIPGKRGRSLEWVLSTLSAHVESLPAPEERDLQGEERLLLDLDPSVQTCCYVLSGYLRFLECFVEEVSLEKRDFAYADRTEHQRGILRRYLLRLLHLPLLFHDLHIDSKDKPKSTVRTLCEKVLRLLSRITRNVMSLFRLDSQKSAPLEDGSTAISLLSLANLSYLLFVERLCCESVPLVYSPTHTFASNLSHVKELLSLKQNLVVSKGLLLSRSLLDGLSDFELVGDTDAKPLFDYSHALFQVAIHCQIEPHRNAAVKLFLAYVKKFDWKGRYHQIMHVVSVIEHSGARGVAINLYKDCLHGAWEDERSRSLFIGHNLQSFVGKVYALPEGAETDILENCDQIITALNLLRYLMLKDDSNVSGIWDLVDDISDSFLAPLRRGLDLSRAHYQLKVRELTVCQHCKESFEHEPAVTVNGETPLNLSPGIQVDIFRRGLVSFDLIESVLARVNEILES